MNLKLDKIDYKVLYHLDYNARIPLSELATKVAISKQNLNYRLKKLTEQKIITGFTSVINIHQLGYLTYRIYFRFKNVDEKKEQEILSYFNRHEYVLWLVSLSGSWDLEVVFTARNYVHLNNMFKKVKEDLGQHFSKYNVSSSIFNYHFKRDYLLNKKREEFTPKYYGFEPTKVDLDALDIHIMIELSKNCRQSNQEIGRKLNVTYHTIKNRIDVLEKKNIISAHRITFDLNKLNRKYYKALLVLSNPTKEQEQKLYTYCAQYNCVAYLVEVLGDWQLEVETEVENQEEFITLLRKIRNNFSELILDYEILQLTKEHKLNYFPMGEKLSNNEPISSRNK